MPQQDYEDSGFTAKEVAELILGSFQTPLRSKRLAQIEVKVQAAYELALLHYTSAFETVCETKQSKLMFLHAVREPCPRGALPSHQMMQCVRTLDMEVLGGAMIGWLDFGKRELISQTFDANEINEWIEYCGIHSEYDFSSQGDMASGDHIEPVKYTLLKRSALKLSCGDIWPDIEADLNHSNANGLATAAKSKKHGYWIKEKALEWASARGKLNVRTGGNIQNSIFPMAGRIHKI